MSWRTRRLDEQRQACTARLALARAAARKTIVVVETDNQASLIALLRSLEPRAVLSLIGSNAVRLHGYQWGQHRTPPKDEHELHAEERRYAG